MNPRKKSLKLLPAILILILNFAFAIEPEPEERLLFDFVNSERIRAKLTPLIWDSELYEVALGHSKDMASTAKMDHRGTDGSLPSERVRRSPVFVSKVGENIGRDHTVISAHTMLMQSLQHRQNILDPEFDHAAVGIAEKEGQLYVTELFVREIKDYPLQDGRLDLLQTINLYRRGKNLAPFLLSAPLNLAAQSHVEQQAQLGTMEPALTSGPASVRFVSIYTTQDLAIISPDIESDVEVHYQNVGIGFTKVRNSACKMGCYLVVLIFN